MAQDSRFRATPQAVLARIRKDREALAVRWAGLNEEQMVRRPGPQDLIAHVTGWESFILERVINLIGGAESEPAEHQDVLNAGAYEQQGSSTHQSAGCVSGQLARVGNPHLLTE